STDETEGCLGQQAAQIQLHSAVTAIPDVRVDGTARLLRYNGLQVGGVADAQLLNVFHAVCVHRIWPGFFRSRNVRTGDDNALGRGFGRSRGCRWCRELSEGVPYKKKRKADARNKSKTKESHLRLYIFHSWFLHGLVRFAVRHYRYLEG